MGKAQDLSFGDLILDETCLFARRSASGVSVILRRPLL
jgi:hypothetical protein